MTKKGLGAHTYSGIYRYRHIYLFIYKDPDIEGDLSNKTGIERDAVVAIYFGILPDIHTYIYIDR